MRKCVIHVETGLCVNVIEDPSNNYVPPDGYYVASDGTGQTYWYWDGDTWFDPTSLYFNAYLGTPSVDTQDISDESTFVANTFWVKQFIQNYLQTEFLPNLTLDGGSFSSTAIATVYDAGLFNDTLSNLSDDFHADLFDDTGGNLTSNIHADTF